MAYTSREFDRDTDFLQAGKHLQVDNIFKDITAKRALLARFYSGLTGPGGESVPLYRSPGRGEASRERVGAAYRRIYRQARKSTLAFERTAQKESEVPFKPTPEVEYVAQELEGFGPTSTNGDCCI